MNLSKLSIKIFCDKSSSDVGLSPYMEIFNEWVRNNSFPGTWIDPVDYSHMKNGPGVILVGFEANFSLDEEAGEAGLLYAYKKDTSESIEEFLSSRLAIALKGCEMLEADPRTKGLKFKTKEILFTLNDRLQSDSLNDLKKPLSALGKKLFSAPVKLLEESSSKRRLSLRLQTESNLSIAELLKIL